MKFSIAFKYSSVTFKNKETKETIAYETKASEGNTFAFDNVDEDVVIGMLKGIKDKKASQLFAYDDLRTNFINVMARNKCKELYDKLDKNEWKIEDIAISNITIKDVEFTKPTMNARETITVESRKKIKESGGSPKFKEGDKVAWYDPKDETILHGGVITDVYDNKTCFMYKVWFEDEELSEVIDEEDLDYDTVYESKKFAESEKKPVIDKLYKARENINEAAAALSMAAWDLNDIREVDVKEIEDKIMKEHDSVSMSRDSIDTLIDEISSGKAKLMESRRMMNESVEPVIFKKDKKDGEVVALFPETMFDGSVNRGNIMCYAHNGQSSEASLGYFQECKPCKDEAEYADLLAELEDYFNQDPDEEPTTLKVVRKPNYGRGSTRRDMWPSRF